MIQVSLVVSGSVQDIGATLEWITDRNSQRTSDDFVEGAAIIRSDQSTDLSRFVDLVTDDGTRFIKILIADSDLQHTAKELANDLGVTENQLYGVVGSLGRLWKKVSGDPNPFASRWSRAKGTAAWSLSDEVASTLKAAFQEKGIDIS